MNMLLYMYSDFIVMGALISLATALTWLQYRRLALGKWPATCLWLVVLCACLVWTNQRYHPVEASRHYLDNGLAISPDLAALANQRRRYIGTTYREFQGSDSSLTLELLQPHFNSVTPPSQLKWRQLLQDGTLGVYDFSEADRLVNSLRDGGMDVRGHTLIWGKWAKITYPEELRKKVLASPDPAQALRQYMKQHITTVMQHFQGRIQRWDVVNEPLQMSNRKLDNNLFHRLLGEDYIAEAFQAARAASPDAILFLNEDFRSFSEENSGRFLSLVRRLLDKGAPIDGVGIQSHHLYALKNLDHMSRFVAALSELGLVFEITELDVPLWLFEASEFPYQAQARYYGEYARICFDNPHCLGVTMWGTHDGDTWLDWVFPFSLRAPNQPLLFDAQMRKKPAYYALRNALSQ